MINTLLTIFRDIFEDPNLNISENTSSDDIPKWDSLNNIKLLISIEQKLNIRFSPSNISGIKNVGELIDLIEELKFN